MGIVTNKRYLDGSGSFIMSISPTDSGSRVTVRVGVDIGQVNDYTAIVVTEQHTEESSEQYTVRSIERVPLRTSFPAIADRIAEVVSSLKRMSTERQEQGQEAFRVELLIDATGVGRPVIDLVKERGLGPIAVTLTGGDALTEKDRDRISMAKSWMVARLQVLLQSDQLILPDTPAGDLLTRELSDYQSDYTLAGNMTFNARSAKHDDLVIALGLSTGTGEKRQPSITIFIGKIKRQYW